MTLKELEARVKVLENQVKALQPLQDIEDIKKLQCAYGYYLEHMMSEEVIDCFADSPDVVLCWARPALKGILDGIKNPHRSLFIR